MKCPRCHKDQPFDFKCVQCEADIAAALQSPKRSLRFYQFTIIALLLLIFWLAWDRPPPLQSTKPPTPASELAAPAQPDRPEPNFNLSRLPFLTNRSAPAGALPLVLALFEKENLAHYRVFSSFQEAYKGPAQIISATNKSEKNLRDVLRNPPAENLLFVAIGREAVAQLSQEELEYPALYLSLEEPLPPEVFGLGPLLPLEQERILIARLFADQKQILAVTDQEIPASTQPTTNVLWFSPQNREEIRREVERQSRNFQPHEVLLWFHQIPAKDRESILQLAGMEKVLSVSGLHLSEAGESAEESAEAESGEVSEAATSALIEMKLSPEGFGRQGAQLMRRLMVQGTEIRPEDQLPLRAIELHVHHQRLVQAEQEEALQGLRARARELGLTVTLFQ